MWVLPRGRAVLSGGRCWMPAWVPWTRLGVLRPSPLPPPPARSWLDRSPPRRAQPRGGRAVGGGARGGQAPSGGGAGGSVGGRAGRRGSALPIASSRHGVTPAAVQLPCSRWLQRATPWAAAQLGSRASTQPRAQPTVRASTHPPPPCQSYCWRATRARWRAACCWRRRCRGRSACRPPRAASCRPGGARAARLSRRPDVDRAAAAAALQHCTV